jgi:hypothetical protein
MECRVPDLYGNYGYALEVARQLQPCQMGLQKVGMEYNYVVVYSFEGSGGVILN